MAIPMDFPPMLTDADKRIVRSIHDNETVFESDAHAREHMEELLREWDVDLSAMNFVEISEAADADKYIDGPAYIDENDKCITE